MCKELHLAQSCQELLKRSPMGIHAVMVQGHSSSLPTAVAASRGNTVRPGPLEFRSRAMVGAAATLQEGHLLSVWAVLDTSKGQEWREFSSCAVLRDP